MRNFPSWGQLRSKTKRWEKFIPKKAIEKQLKIIVNEEWNGNKQINPFSTNVFTEYRSGTLAENGLKYFRIIASGEQSKILYELKQC